jgi:hypothetical protein
LAAGGVAQGAGNEGLAHPGGPGDQDDSAVPQPLSPEETSQERFVQPPRGPGS